MYGDYYYDSGLLTTVFIIEVILIIITIIALWKLFQKAGRPGWAAIIPIYNTYIMTEIAGLPWWWLLIMYLGWIIPFIGWIASIIASIYILWMFVKSYGKDTGFIILTIILPFIMLPVMAFSSSTTYVGPAALKNKQEGEL